MSLCKLSDRFFSIHHDMQPLSPPPSELFGPHRSVKCFFSTHGHLHFDEGSFFIRSAFSPILRVRSYLPNLLSSPFFARFGPITETISKSLPTLVSTSHRLRGALLPVSPVNRPSGPTSRSLMPTCSPSRTLAHRLGRKSQIAFLELIWRPHPDLVTDQ